MNSIQIARIREMFSRGDSFLKIAEAIGSKEWRVIEFCKEQGWQRNRRHGPPRTIERRTTCLHCGVKLKPTAKKYCSQKCQFEYQSNQTLKHWLKTGQVETKSHTLPQPVRRYLIEQAGHKCSECGWDKINPSLGYSPLHIDHIDGDYKNNHISNLKVLCPSCHSLTPTYGSLNKGSGRPITWSWK